jgi:hypothetical protein
MRPTALIGLALITTAACAGHTAPATNGPDATTSSTSPAASRNRDIITRDELTKASVVNMTVLDAVRSLRPQYLTVRGTNTMAAKQDNNPDGKQIVDQESGKPHASIDGNKVVALEELSGIRAGSVLEIRFLSPAAAMQRFGGSARQGPVILVKTM